MARNNEGELFDPHLGIAHVQNIMRLDQPDALDLRYTQKMMGFLAELEVVERDPNVIASRLHFMIPDDDHRFKVIRADGTRHLAAARQAADVLTATAAATAAFSAKVTPRSAAWTRSSRSITWWRVVRPNRSKSCAAS